MMTPKSKDSSSKNLPPTWCFRVVVPAHVATAVVRASVHDRIAEMPTWRAPVVRSDLKKLSLTCSVAGGSREEAFADASAVIDELGLPESAFHSLAAPECDDDGALVPGLVGVAEVAEMLTVSKQHISESAKKGAHWLPQPVARVSATPLWLRSEIAELAVARSRASSGAKKTLTARASATQTRKTVKKTKGAKKVSRRPVRGG